MSLDMVVEYHSSFAFDDDAEAFGYGPSLNYTLRILVNIDLTNYGENKHYVWVNLFLILTIFERKKHVQLRLSLYLANQRPFKRAEKEV